MLVSLVVLLQLGNCCCHLDVGR